MYRTSFARRRDCNQMDWRASAYRKNEPIEGEQTPPQTVLDVSEMLDHNPSAGLKKMCRSVRAKKNNFPLRRGQQSMRNRRECYVNAHRQLSQFHKKTGQNVSK